jgi:hypothetical protein
MFHKFSDIFLMSAILCVTYVEITEWLAARESRPQGPRLRGRCHRGVDTDPFVFCEFPVVLISDRKEM